MNPTRRDFLKSSVITSTLLAHAGVPVSADQPRPPANPFLEGNFAPVREEVTADNLRIIGQIPRELNGMFVRNGPNPQFTPRGRYHWFDGDGMLHGVRLHEGRASYRNRYVRTAGWQEENRAGRAIYTGLLEPPDLTRAVRGGAPYKNVANTALVWFDGRLLALWEGGEPHALRVPSLETVGPYNFGGRLRHAFTAHPKVDAQNGEMIFFGYQVARPFLSYGVANPRGEIVHATTIDLPRAVMMHDFAITPRYSLFLDLPETLSLDRLLRGQPMMRFEPDLGARVGILARRGEGRDIRWFTISPCFVFHTLNAYEDGDDVVLIACRMREFPEAINGGDGALNANSTPHLHRWSFNMRSGAVREQALDDAAVEFPRCNESWLGRRTRYGYLARTSGLQMDGLLKFDFDTNRSMAHNHGRNRFGGEGIFVPRPGGRAEDDGWVIAFIHDQAENRSEMVVIDARNFAAQPVARVILPARVPYGFHGTWIAAENLRS